MCRKSCGAGMIEPNWYCGGKITWWYCGCPLASICITCTSCPCGCIIDGCGCITDGCCCVTDGCCCIIGDCCSTIGDCDI
uniref:Uncharacterized protein n=1 Tax=Romanomermis culicivorax TaxID=13658 RepID=A0A915ILA1_ROMCU